MSGKINYEQLREKYSFAVALFNGHKIYTQEEIVLVTVAENCANTINELLAIEVFLKLIIDMENDKLDTVVNTHSIKDLWNTLSETAKLEIEKRAGCKFDDQLPGDMYTQMRYYWSPRRKDQNGVYPSSLLPALKSFFEDVYVDNTNVYISDKKLKVMKFDGKNWIRI